MRDASGSDTACANLGAVREYALRLLQCPISAALLESLGDKTMLRATDSKSLHPMALTVMTTACCLLGMLPAKAEPFTGFAGRWTGGGDVVMTDGSQERIRCKAKYSTGGGQDSLHTNVRCASDSYRVHILIELQAEGGSLSGTWEETTRQVSGDVSGQIPAPGQIQASLGGLGFGIQLAATTNGRQQAITIQSQNTDVRSVKIVLRRE